MIEALRYDTRDSNLLDSFSLPKPIMRPNLPRTESVSPSRCVRKSLFSIADAITMGRSCLDLGGWYVYGRTLGGRCGNPEMVGSKE